MKSVSEGNRRVDWVDFAKFFAIIAVMINHTVRDLHFTKYVRSYYGVPVFILVMGVVSYWSYDRSSVLGLKKACRSCWGVLRPYIMATFIYCLVGYGGMFVFDKFIFHLLKFNASGPHYYVLLYLQLALAAPIVFRTLSAIGMVKNLVLRNVLDLLFMIFVLGIAWFTTNYTNIHDVFGGGGKLLGGTFFFLFCVGMWFGRQLKRKTLSINIWILVGLLVVFALMMAFWGVVALENKNKLDIYCHIGRAVNPPGICYGMYGFLVAAFLFLLGNLLDRLPVGNVLRRVYGFIAFLGRHTLYMFLYHRLFIDYVFVWLFALTGISIENIWLKRLLYFTGMIGGSLALEFAVKWVHGIFVRAYFQMNPCNTAECASPTKT